MLSCPNIQSYEQMKMQNNKKIHSSIFKKKSALIIT